MHHDGVPMYPESVSRHIVEEADRFGCLTKYFEGEQPLDVVVRTNALCVAGIIDEGTRAVVKMFANGENGKHELFSASSTRQTFLVHFGRDAKSIGPDAKAAWREYFEDICHRMGDLRIVASGLQLSDERHEQSRHFLKELAFWTELQQV